MSDFIPPEKPTADVTPLHPAAQPRDPGPVPGYPNLRPRPPWKPGECGHPNPGGRRRRLTEAFITDFQTIWETEGLAAILRVARSDPPTFVKVAASLLPKDINLKATLDVDATTFATNFRQAVELLGNELPSSRRMKVIDVDDTDHH
ncbi:hypothetical protein SAMN05216525_13347 [Bradyrhizobium sp. Gha]|nr:hypothetical protein SAMN05216525_13347 [Bradyrhizobium sp. Gha]